MLRSRTEHHCLHTVRLFTPRGGGGGGLFAVVWRQCKWSIAVDRAYFVRKHDSPVALLLLLFFSSHFIPIHPLHSTACLPIHSPKEQPPSLFSNPTPQDALHAPHSVQLVPTNLWSLTNLSSRGLRLLGRCKVLMDKRIRGDLSLFEGFFDTLVMKLYWPSSCAGFVSVDCCLRPSNVVLLSFTASPRWIIILAVYW